MEEQPIMSISEEHAVSPIVNPPVSDKWVVYETMLFEYSFLISLALQIFLGLFVQIVDPHAFRRHYTHAGIVLVIFIVELIQLFVLCFITIQVFSRMKRGYVSPYILLHMFLSNIVAFAGLYTLCFSTSRAAFHISAFHKTEEQTMSVFDIFALFSYYSICTMSSTGLGDIVATHWIPQMISCIHMLIAMLYFTGIFVIGLNHFTYHKSRVFDPSTFPISSNSVLSLSARIDSKLDSVTSIADLRRFVCEFLLSTTAALEAFAFLVIYVAERHMMTPENRQSGIVLSCLVLLHVILMLIIISIVFKSAANMQANRFDVSIGLIVQGFLASVLIFSGVFFSVFVVSGPISFHFTILSDQKPQDSISLMFQFIYFSISIQTSSGFGDIYPASGLAWFAVSLHVLVSSFYSVAILGLGLSQWSRSITKSIKKTAILSNQDDWDSTEA